MDRPVTVMIVGQDRILVEAMAVWLGGRPDIRVVSPRPPTGREGPGDLAAAEHPEPAEPAEPARGVDVVLIDSSLRRDEALAATCRAAEELAGAKPVVFGLDREDEAVVDFIEAGALAYVVKGTPARELARIIRDVHAGNTRCSPHVASTVVRRIAQLARDREAPRALPGEPLTPRETEVLRRIAVGLSNKEIGKGLRISVSTVKNHVHNILEKLEVGHRREAVKLAYRLGLIAEEQAPPPPPKP